jgi:hypothetical protein
MNLCPHFRVLRPEAPRRAWALALSFEDQQKIWDVPRGAPLRARDRHLAIERTPSNAAPNIGECWDAGPCEVRKWMPRHIVIVLHGAKINGCFSLVRFRRYTQPHWLWVRVRPGNRTRRPVSPAPAAVLCGTSSL